LKTAHLLILTTAMLGTLAHAQTATETATDNFNLSVGLAADTCINASNEITCTQSAGGTSTTVSIPLSNCQTIGNGDTDCNGYWSSTVTVDAVIFTAMVSVSQATTAAGVVSYNVEIGVGQSDSTGFTWATILPANAGLTDSTALMGAMVPSAAIADTSYLPVLYVGPVTDNSETPKVIRF
jgi:hypothetical protein